jgi:hypothetical protein
MTEIEWIIIMVCGFGLGYTSYRIGFKEGTSKMIDFCKSKRNKQGLTCMHFFGENIEFIDALEYNKAMLDGIAKALDDEQSS